MRKYLEYFEQDFPENISDLTSCRNWPYAGFSVT